ncbi:DUF3285 domain-containing protein [Trichocoleus desertorum AS-A10]|uniref:DUF3285 domain-containing protein n=1 Tax=Trichocoleus desertorum TaxID=1481672 RepID=UPI003298FDA8
MNSDSLPAEPSIPPATDAGIDNASPEAETSPKPSYVKLAMRNMVRKRGKSLWHFTLTTVGLFTVLIGLAYLTR